MFELRTSRPPVFLTTVLFGFIALSTTGCSFDGAAPITIIEESSPDTDAGIVDDISDLDDVEDVTDVSDTGEEPVEREVDGAPCSTDDHCQGGTCLLNDYWRGGYCTTNECQTDSDCAGDSGQHLCVDHPYQGSICVTSCDYGGSDACRAMYECRPHTSTEAWCGPRIDSSPLVPSAYIEECTQAVDGELSFDFEISPSASSYFLGLRIGSQQGTLHPESIDLPDGDKIDFFGENAFQIRPDYAQSGLSTILIPGADRFDDQVQPGSHTLTVNTSANSVCLYVIEDRDPSEVIDINVYLLGMEDKDLTFTTAASHPDFQAVLDETSVVLSQVGLSLGEVRYFELPQNIAEQYRVLHDASELYWLLNHSLSPGDGMDRALSVNAFFTERFALPALGLSAGAPGYAAMQGSYYSGVAVSGEYLATGDQGNALASTTLAHELGHFLGLDHTSEMDGETFDFIDDTPECVDANPQEIWTCPDWGNLMFPAAYPDNRNLTPGQGFVLRSNPLSK